MFEAAVPSPNTFPVEEPMGLLKEGLEPNEAVPPKAGEPPNEGGLPKTGALPKPPADEEESFVTRLRRTKKGPTTRTQLNF